MKPLTAIVVEDERFPRLALLQKLEDFRKEVEVVDSCDNYDSALQSILRHQPDLLFLDIQLQGRDAMQLLDEVKQTLPLPHVIFTTAYADRKYLLNAIKLDAVDYLLKPIEKNELAAAITKACQQHQEKPSTNTSPTRLSLRTANGKLFIEAHDIAYITGEAESCVTSNFYYLKTEPPTEYCDKHVKLFLDWLASEGKIKNTFVRASE